MIFSFTPPPKGKKRKEKKLSVGFLLFSNMFTQVFMYSRKFPMGFPICSQSFQCVPQYVVLKKSSICLISFALSSTLVTYITSPKGKDNNIGVPILGLSKA
jgi:hypothetical protein